MGPSKSRSVFGEQRKGSCLWKWPFSLPSSSLHLTLQTEHNQLAQHLHTLLEFLSVIQNLTKVKKFYPMQFNFNKAANSCFTRKGFN